MEPAPTMSGTREKKDTVPALKGDRSLGRAATK